VTRQLGERPQLAAGSTVAIAAVTAVKPWFVAVAAAVVVGAVVVGAVVVAVVVAAAAAAAELLIAQWLVAVSVLHSPTEDHTALGSAPGSRHNVL
jgi:hypothetical protein